jgi:tRNA (adenine57-N1/adenine58-N1)-methyltransferase
MSTSLARAVAPTGKVDTYEFNLPRVEAAREEFERNGISRLVRVHHRDVCGKEGSGGFAVAAGTRDAVFLDLPEPWLAVAGAADAMKGDGRLCSYSPCIEQAQKCTAALMKGGFHSVRTVEVRLKEFFVDVVEREEVDAAVPFYVGGVEIDRRVKEAGVANSKKAKGGKGGGGGKRKKGEEEEEEGGRDAGGGGGGERIVRARPAAEMRGHTAFLTFATRRIR